MGLTRSLRTPLFHPDRELYTRSPRERFSVRIAFSDTKNQHRERRCHSIITFVPSNLELIGDPDFVGLTDQSFTCTPAHHSQRDAARPLPRLAVNSAGANCNGHDAVAHADAGASSSGPANGGVTGATMSWAATLRQNPPQRFRDLSYCVLHEAGTPFSAHGRPDAARNSFGAVVASPLYVLTMRTSLSSISRSKRFRATYLR
jgi:hypothetical protein